jgi:hypothetical protein
MERFARRQAGWLAEIAGLLVPLDPPRAAQSGREAIQRLSGVPERMGPEDLAAPLETPTGQLLRLAHCFHEMPAIAHQARRAALERACAAAWPGGRVYALCLIARESARAAPELAHEALQEARVRTVQLPADQRLGAQAALAGSLAVAASREAARPVVTAILQKIDRSPPEPAAIALIASLMAPAAPDAANHLAERAVERATTATVLPEEMPFRGSFREPLLAAQHDPDRPVTWPPPWGIRRFIRQQASGSATDAQLRRVAAVLATTHPAVARRAARLIHHAGDRAGALIELAALIEEQDPARAASLYREALKAGDELARPAAARRAARVRAAAGLAAYDAPAARAVVEPLPPRLIALELDPFAARLARQDPAAALRLIQRAELSVAAGDGPARPLFPIARATVAARLARRDPDRAASLVASLPARRSVDAWLAFARAMAAPDDR